MNRLLALGVTMTVVASACLGSGVALKVQPVTNPRPRALAAHAWLAGFASREARALGDPSLKTALVGPITAAQARLVFQHRRRAYPGDTYLVVLHGSFVTPNLPCPAAAAGCGFNPERLFGWQVMLASPTLGRTWRYFGIETDGLRPQALPVPLKRIALRPDPAARPTGRLLRFAVAQANQMHGSQMLDFGFARLSPASASHVFGGERSAGYLVVERGLFRRSPGSTVDRHPWFSWAALEYRPGLAGRPAAFRVLPPPRNPNAPVPGIRVDWTGLPQLGNPGPHFYSGGDLSGVR
jgi:hypothetical protein